MRTQVVLDRKKAEAGLLPPFCFHCGKACDLYEEKRYLWGGSAPLPLGLIGLFIPVVSILLFFKSFETVRIPIPLCADHCANRQKSNFSGRTLTGLFLIILSVVGVFFVPPEGYYILAVIIVGGILLIIFPGASYGYFPAGEITGWSITLSGVSTEFLCEFDRVGYLTVASNPKNDLKDDKFSFPKYPGL